MRKQTILFADDDSSFAKKYTEYFEENGFSVVIARDGQEAFRLFLELSPDVALLDIKFQNPKYDGFWIAKKIRRENIHVPILFITANGDEDTAVKSFKVGGFDFIRKGVGNKELLSRIKHSLQDHHPLNKKPIRKLTLTPDTCLDLINNTLISNGRTENLSQKECELLQTLYWHINEPQKRELVMNQIWSEAGSAPEYMNKAICQLRKLLSPDKKIKLVAKRRASITLFIEENSSSDEKNS